MNAIKTATSARLRWVIDKLRLKEASISVIKVRPPEPVGRQGKSSALVAEPGNPKIVPAIGVI